MFRGSVKCTGYPLHSPVSPSFPLPCVTVCHHISTGVYYITSVSIFLQKAEIKKKKFEHEDVGVRLYDTQETVTKQQALIHSYHETVSKISKIRQEMEAQVEAHKKTYEYEQQKLHTAQKKGYI